MAIAGAGRIGCPEELADMLEVIDAVLEWKGFSLEDVKKIQTAKRLERGGFSEGIILEES